MKLRPFELAMIVIFGSMFLIALLLLGSFEGGNDPEKVRIGNVNIWGTLPEREMNSVLEDIADNYDDAFETVYYTYVPEDEFDIRFLNALADQRSPDLLLLSHEKLVEHRNRLQPIPYETFPLVDYRNLYIDGADIFALNDGIYGFPLVVNPLVMYWNRDIFSSEGFVKPPSTWEELVSETVPSITLRDFNRNIQRSAVAMGEYNNIRNAFGIISLLTIQGGSRLVVDDSGYYRMQLNQTHSADTVEAPFNTAMSFYTNFSNVNNTLYSWNRTLPEDRDRFLSEDLALYFGYASEGREIQAKNPNLNFDVTEVPQGANATIRRTYGDFYALVIPKFSNNMNGAYAAAETLAGEQFAKTIADQYNMAPVNRNALQTGSNDVYGRTAYQSAVRSRGWLNPDIDKTDEILTGLLVDVSANRKDVYSATGDAMRLLESAYKSN